MMTSIRTMAGATPAVIYRSGSGGVYGGSSGGGSGKVMTPASSTGSSYASNLGLVLLGAVTAFGAGYGAYRAGWLRKWL
jgi:hypothetical protein